MLGRLRLDRLQLLGCRGARRRLGEGEAELVALAGDPDDAALGELAEEQLLGERLLDVLLNDAAQGTRAEQAVVALLGEPFSRRLVELDRDVAVGQLLLELEGELVYAAAASVGRERGERPHAVEPGSDV